MPVFIFEPFMVHILVCHSFFHHAHPPSQGHFCCPNQKLCIPVSHPSCLCPHEDSAKSEFSNNHRVQNKHDDCGDGEDCAFWCVCVCVRVCVRACVCVLCVLCVLRWCLDICGKVSRPSCLSLTPPPNCVCSPGTNHPTPPLPTSTTAGITAATTTTKAICEPCQSSASCGKV